MKAFAICRGEKKFCGNYDDECVGKQYFRTRIVEACCGS
jgi:hypothetical protein